MAFMDMFVTFLLLVFLLRTEESKLCPSGSGNTFPARPSEASTIVSVQRGRRQTLTCHCAPSDAQVSVVYWSVGEGVTADTDIIAARFSDGTFLQVRHGADYSISRNFSLTVNSVSGNNTGRYWCHVFLLNGTRQNCYIEVHVAVGSQTNQALRASATSFYLREGRYQTIPCTTWAPGDEFCLLQWYKVDLSGRRLVLNYSVSTNAVSAVSGFDLSDDYGLSFTSVNFSHAGRYSCHPGYINSSFDDLLDCHVFGEQFPLGSKPSVRGTSVTYEPGKVQILRCPTGLNVTAMSKATLLWSFGARDANSVTVIGRIDIVDGNSTVSELGKICVSISSEGSLHLDDCPQNGDVRYWCHVFANNELWQSYIDVLTQDRAWLTSVIVSAVFVIIAVIAFLIFKYRKHRSNGHQDGYSAIEGTKLKSRGIVEECKEFLRTTLLGLPTIPWLTEDDGCCAWVEDVYSSSELLAIMYVDGRSVKYRIHSTNEIFEDGISMPSSNVLLQGRAGSGKTFILYKMAYDWACEKSESVFQKTKIVFLLPVQVLLETRNVGEAVKKCMLSSKTQFSSENVNEYCVEHLSNVVILVDGCSGKDDVTGAWEVLKEQGLLECQVVMTIRQAQEAEDVCKKYNFRHVLTNGFNLSGHLNRYVEKLLGSKVHDNLLDYLDKDVLPPKLSRLPVVIRVLCLLSSWTNDEAFRDKPTMTDLLTRLVRCLFDSNMEKRKKNFRSMLTKEQLGMVAELGRVIFDKVCEGSGDPFSFSESSFREISRSAQTFIENCLKSGLICRTQEIIRSGETEKIPLAETGSKSHISFRGLVDKPNTETEVSELVPLARTNENVHFIPEILGEFCAGSYLSSAEKGKLLESARKADVDKLANILVFASQRSVACRSEVIEFLVERVSESMNRVQNIASELEVQKVIDLCLQVNFEGKCKCSLNKDLRSMFPEGRLRLFGISRHRLRLLSYLLEHAEGPSTDCNLNLKSIELFRFEQHDWEEIQEYLEEFVPGSIKSTTCKRLHNPKQHLKKEITSRTSKDQMFLHRQSERDSAVLTLESIALEDLRESQSGNCQMSSSSQSFVLSLSHLTLLDSVVLVGSILNPGEICSLANHALRNLPKLKRLDLRLNKEFDDAAFTTVMFSLPQWKSLIDLRLSLFKVTPKGFSEVAVAVKEEGLTLGRLTTFYLLHSQPSDSFAKFLTTSLVYLNNLKSLHISGCVGRDSTMSESALKELEKGMKESQLRGNAEFVVDRMEPLSTRLSSKDKKRRKTEVGQGSFQSA
ncbi:uncharacterized protein LOC110987702 isoform X2 [Acanthaster planci]|uniref:Uncharacterized protein LOC110987702 isoform X2 n=1 Tax=Acanthaster planci TaxID=133434 RepID=A0A8B7ZLN5_ACAPL|nr:uncharacterized protein LOC110987702 isoform X2 [Acanthaster planci]